MGNTTQDCGGYNWSKSLSVFPLSNSRIQPPDPPHRHLSVSSSRPRMRRGLQSARCRASKTPRNFRGSMSPPDLKRFFRAGHNALAETHQRKNLAPSAAGLPAATAATCKQYTGQGEVFLEVSGFRGSELGKQSQRRDSESVPRDMQRTRETHYWLPRQHPSMGPWLHAEGHLRQGPSLKALLPCRTLSLGVPHKTQWMRQTHEAV